MPEGERVLTEIQKVIGEDPTIADTKHVVVTVEKKSIWQGRKERVVLKGSVRSDIDRTKIEKIASLHAAGREVVNEITVVH
jgi:hypothetical protein